MLSTRETQTSTVSAASPSPQFRLLSASRELRRGCGEEEEGHAGVGDPEPPGRRSPRATGPGLRERRCSGDSPTDRASICDTLTCGADFHSWSWGECFQREGRPPLGGKEAAQGATRRDRHSHSAPRRGGGGFVSATGLRKLSSGRAAVGRQHATRREGGECEARRGSSARNLRRPRPLTLRRPLHDCGAAADLPGGRPRKPAGVSSAAPARRTSKPRLSGPSRAAATSVRTRPAPGTQGRCRGAGGSAGRSLAHARRGAASAGQCRPETTRRGGARATPVRIPASLRRRGGRCSLPGEEPTWSEAGQGAVAPVPRATLLP